MPQSPRRILSIWLARLAIDRWRLLEGCGEGAGADGQPIALVTDTAHGPRIDAANRAGLDAGAHPGMRLADARALCPVIAVRPSDPAGDLAFLENLAVWAQRWGPWSAELFRAHIHQPGHWILRDDARLAAEPATPPNSSDLAGAARDRSLAAG